MLAMRYNITKRKILLSCENNTGADDKLGQFLNQDI
jgi:hypothetical protein